MDRQAGELALQVVERAVECGAGGVLARAAGRGELSSANGSSPGSTSASHSSAVSAVSP